MVTSREPLYSIRATEKMVCHPLCCRDRGKKVICYIFEDVYKKGQFSDGQFLKVYLLRQKVGPILVLLASPNETSKYSPGQQCHLGVANKANI